MTIEIVLFRLLMLCVSSNWPVVSKNMDFDSAFLVDF